MHVKLMDRLITTALTRPGFNLVELMTPCHTQYGRKNGFKTNVDMYKWYKKHATPLERYEKMTPEEREERIPIGVFRERTCQGLEERYEAMRQNLREGR